MLQSMLDQDAIDKLPLTKEAIKTSSNRVVALREIGRSTPALDDMSEAELSSFDSSIAKLLKNRAP